MVYLKCILAGIAGSIVVFVSFIVVFIIVVKVFFPDGGGTIANPVVKFLPLASIVVGFVTGFFLMMRRSLRSASTIK